MAEIATIARPYAEALFKAQTSDLSATGQWLGELAALSAQPQLLQFAENPNVQPAQVLELMAGLVRSPLPEAGKNFLRLLIENGRLKALPEIAAQFHALNNAVEGSADALVLSAFPIAPDALRDLTATLERRFNRRLAVTVELDPSLIGGIRVVVGDEVLDASVKARLEQMKTALLLA